MTDLQIGRVERLIEELRSYGDEGAIDMLTWMLRRREYEAADGALYSRAARANPCGTAACIAGKAALMQMFMDEGFFWDFDQAFFSIPPSEFFGRAVNDAVFEGRWAMHNIHTPAQAVILMEHFLDVYRCQAGRTAPGGLWQPSEHVVASIRALLPEAKLFPVTGVQIIMEADDQLCVTEYAIRRLESGIQTL